MRLLQLRPETAKTDDGRIAVIEQIYDSPNLDQREFLLANQIPYLVRLARIGAAAVAKTDTGAFRRAISILRVLADQCREQSEKLTAEGFQPQAMIEKRATLSAAADMIQREALSLFDARHKQEKTILEHYGLPGTDWHTQDGEPLLMGVVGRLGFEALSDAAIALLADKHVEHQRIVSR